MCRNIPTTKIKIITAGLKFSLLKSISPPPPPPYQISEHITYLIPHYGQYNTVGAIILVHRCRSHDEKTQNHNLTVQTFCSRNFRRFEVLNKIIWLNIGWSGALPALYKAFRIVQIYKNIYTNVEETYLSN